ncbi:hypothetical protein GIB67_037645 [Kingdonia uniflora]|uniref:Uncharacterized protein n=1 Tax=Kingdonia uniflora TaxID=39325 RepID=A0A7J7LSV0_9MAGN|nr:hypothetical protein GIB67_037645 [Kingdonia uniflora]
MALISGCAKADEEDLVGQLTPVIGVRDDEDIVAELIEWPRLKGSRVEYPTGSSRFREFCKAKSSIDWIWGHAFVYRGNFFRTCNISQGGNYLYLLPDLAQEKKYRHLGDEVSLEYLQGVVKDSRIDGLCYYLAQFDYGLTLPLSNLAKRQLIVHISRLVLQDHASSTCLQQGECKTTTFYGCLVNVFSGINCKVSRKESFIDVIFREDTELEAALKELEISRFKRVTSKDDKVRRSQAKRRLVGKTLGSMEEILLTPELNAPLKLTRFNEILDRPVDVTTVSSTVVRNMAKRKAVKRGAAPRSVTSEVLEESDKVAEGADLSLRFEVEASLLEEQCQAKAREKMVAVMEDEFKKFAHALRDVQLDFQDRSMELEKRISQLEGKKNQLGENLIRERGSFQLEREKERDVAALKLKEVRAEIEAEAERLVTALAISQNNLARMLYQLRYTIAEIMAFSEGNYEEMEIMDEEEVEEREDGLNVAEKTSADNKKTINQKELDIAKEREEQTLLYNAEYAEEYEVLFSQYEDRLDDNVKLSLKLEGAKRQVEQKTAAIFSRDLALNQLTSELAELKEKAASGSRHEAELAEYHIRALNEEISDMKCNIRALN